MDGVVLVDKPAGKTSHDVVAGVRRARGGKVGHAGTLDPFATGLLLVLVGRATRAQRFFMALPKTYFAVAQFGAVSSTGDPEGEIRETGVQPPEPLNLPVGEIRQRPPAHSAVKVGGERAYRLARRGQAVEMPVRRSVVHELDLLDYDGRVARLDLRVGSGTYVRSIAAALGGHCRTLRRTEVGPFRIAEADPDSILPPEQALARLG